MFPDAADRLRRGVGEFDANPLVAFLGRVSDEELKATYGAAKALLFPGLEDFGIVPVEAQAAGTGDRGCHPQLCDNTKFFV